MARRIIVSTALGLVAVGACSTPPDVPLGPDGRPDRVLAEGRDIYGDRCSSCHGTSGGGGRGPNIQGERVVEKYPGVGDQMSVVLEGRNQMPAFGDALTADQIEAVVRYTREVL